MGLYRAGNRNGRHRLVGISGRFLHVREHDVSWTHNLEDDPMDPENHWLVEENTLPML